MFNPSNFWGSLQNRASLHLLKLDGTKLLLAMGSQCIRGIRTYP